MKEEKFFKNAKKLTASLLAAVLTFSTASVLPSFAAEESVDSTQLHATGLIPDSKAVMKEHEASDEEVYDLDFIQSNDSATHDALVNICKTAKIVGLPDKVDLSSKFPAVGDQGNCGSCTAWATTYYMRTYQEGLEHGWSLKNSKHIFSPAFTYNMLNGGKDNGLSISNAMDFLADKGSCSIYNMKYDPAFYDVLPNKSQIDCASNYKTEKDWSSLNQVNDIKKALADGNAVTVSMVVNKDFDNLNSTTNPVIDNYDKSSIDFKKWSTLDEEEKENTDYNRGGHALCLVGYDDNYSYDGKTVPVFKFINSWGTSWGHDGFGYVTYDTLQSYYGSIDGYTTLDKSHKDTSEFFTSAAEYLKVKKAVRAYNSPDYFVASDNKDNYAYTIPENSIIKIKEFVGCENGQQPYFVTDQGYYLNAQKEYFEETTLENSDTIILNGDEVNNISSRNQSETSTLSFTQKAHTEYNNHETLKLDYNINQNDSYNGYAGAKIHLAQTTPINNANGITFKYMTPDGQNGTVALCLQGSVAKKIVELPTTNGEWKTYRSTYNFNASSISDIEMYINGNEGGCKTTPSKGSIYFAEIAIGQGNIKQYKLNATSGENCKVEGNKNGYYDESTLVTVEARPDEGYKFIGWSEYEGGEIFNTDQSYSVNINSDINLYPNVKKLNKYYFWYYYTEGGMADGEWTGYYYEGTQLTLQAHPDNEHNFDGWYDNPEFEGEPLSKLSSYTFTLEKDTILWAKFKKKPPKYTLSVIKGEGCKEVRLNYYTANNVVFDRGLFEKNSKVTLTAYNESGYEFKGWYTNSSFTGDPVCTDAKYTFYTTGEMALYPKFEKVENYMFRVYSTPNYMGTVEASHGFQAGHGIISGNEQSGTNITVTAKPNKGYKFIGWYDGSSNDANLISKSATYIFTLNKETDLYAKFDEVTECNFRINYRTFEGSVDYSLGTMYSQGTISGSCKKGTDITVTAKPNKGYKFVGWCDGSYDGTVLSTSSTYTFTVVEDTYIYAKFVENTEKYIFRAYSQPNYMGTVDSDQGFNAGHGIVSGEAISGTNITVTAKPNNGYKFIGWYDGSSSDANLISKSATYTFTLNKETNLYAKFEEKVPEHIFRVYFRTFEGTVDYSQGTMYRQGTISGSCVEGTDITVTAKPNDGYKFVGWCDGSYDGPVISTSSTYTFTVNKETDLYAKFAEETVSDDSNILVKGISNEISSWTNANSGSYLNITSGSSDYLFNGAKTLKLDYNINTNDQYGGYAGRTVSLESTYKNDSSKGYNGIGFWYMTPADFNGQIALCLQSTNGLDDLVQLPATNGEWKYYFYETDKTNLSDLTLYINGSKNGYTTTASNDIAQGTLYMANIEVAKK